MRSLMTYVENGHLEHQLGWLRLFLDSAGSARQEDGCLPLIEERPTATIYLGT
jgi:hypothetical protein